MTKSKPFPSIPSERVRPTLADQPRITLTSCRVAPDTLRQITDWRCAMNVSAGIALDRIVAHAVATGFSTSLFTTKS